MGGIPPSEVVSRDTAAPLTPAQARAYALAERFPEAREALEFYAAIIDFQGDWPQLRTLVASKGSALLRNLAAGITESEVNDAVGRYLKGDDCDAPASFFARILLRRDRPKAASVHANLCPECGQPPQCGCFRPEGHGTAFFLVCSLCATEWPFPRAQCPACGEPSVFYASQRAEYLQTQVCDACSRYLHVIHTGKDPAAIPLVDEVAALAMDVWALERGLRKIHPNLVGV